MKKELAMPILKKYNNEFHRKLLLYFQHLSIICAAYNGMTGRVKKELAMPILKKYNNEFHRKFIIIFPAFIKLFVPLTAA